MTIRDVDSYELIEEREILDIKSKGYIFVNQNYLVPFTFLFLVTGLTATFGVPVADLLA